MRKAQASGFVSLRIKPAADKKSPDVLMTIQDKNIPAELADELAQLRKMLRLDPKHREFKVVIGMLPDDQDEIAFRTRSVLRIMTFLALNVEVPSLPPCGRPGARSGRHELVDAATTHGSQRLPKAV